MSEERYAATQPVDSSNKMLLFSDFFSLWFSLGVGLAVLETGALLAPGLGFWGSVAAIIIGSLVGVFFLALMGWMGFRHGQTSMALMGGLLGSRGIWIPSFLNMVQLMGWGAFEIILMRDGATLLMKQWLGADSFWTSSLLWTLILGVLATLQAIGGPLTWFRIFLRRFGLWIVVIACGWLSVRLFTQPLPQDIWSVKGDGSMPFALGTDIVISMALSWLPLIADYTRFGRKAGSTVSGTVLGYLLGTIWIMVLGTAYILLGTDHSDMSQLMVSLSLASAGLPLFFILLDETENAYTPIHSAAVSGNLLCRLNTSYLSCLFGVVSIIVASVVPVSAFLDFLLWIGSLFAPLFAMLLVDYWLLKRSTQATRLFSWGVAVAWIGGVVVYHLMATYAPSWGATLPAMIASGLLRLVVAFGQSKWRVLTHQAS
ncbi:cytosine permease [Celerinatantimonas sp. YJH-8]|uniref:cytosine permease n=1 Tax=Celerinatantimonas sp. YJH-8 TaxID=3228714 RepID=UPI0038C1840B